MIVLHAASDFPERSQKGFTLIELSVVLVIIGLIVGGVLAGRDLILASEIRGTVSQFNQFQSAVNTFRGKYSCYPGDCRTATDFFGNDPVGCAQQQVSEALDSGTCNGNGSTVLGDYDLFHLERMMFWQQLSQANLIAGRFSGHVTSQATGAYWNAYQPVNAPPGKIPSTGWVADHTRGAVWSDGNYLTNGTVPPEIAQGFLLYLGDPRPGNGNGPVFSPGLTPAQAYAIDSKLDDGRPGLGRIQVMGASFRSGYIFTCASALAGGTNYPSAAATYNFSNTSPDCVLMFLAAF